VPAPLDRSASWPHEQGEPGRYSYARAANPTTEAAEAALGALDGGRALLFPSGMAAVTTVVLTLLRPGSTVALAAGAYYVHRQLLDHLAHWQVQVAEYDQTGAPPAAADLVFVEAPANPMLTMPDFGGVVTHSARVVCDATIATPLFVRPLELGCDIALHSATKYLGGHDDLLAGVLATSDEALYERLRETRHLTGAVPAPDTAWLLLRGLETLEARLHRQTESARALAERLEQHASVATVRYPGFGGLVSFDVADEAAARRVETAVRLIVNATSFGGTRSKLEGRHRWEGERCPPGLLRLSVGLEDADELWQDLDHALGHAAA
jgi:cystathionine gamma-synthase